MRSDEFIPCFVFLVFSCTCGFCFKLSLIQVMSFHTFTPQFLFLIPCRGESEWLHGAQLSATISIQSLDKKENFTPTFLPFGEEVMLAKKQRCNLSATSINFKPPNDKKYILSFKFRSICNGPNHNLLPLYRSQQENADLCQLTVWAERNSDIYYAYSLFVMSRPCIGFIKFQDVNKTRIF